MRTVHEVKMVLVLGDINVRNQVGTMICAEPVENILMTFYLVETQCHNAKFISILEESH